MLTENTPLVGKLIQNSPSGQIIKGALFAALGAVCYGICSCLVRIVTDLNFNPFILLIIRSVFQVASLMTVEGFPNLIPTDTSFNTITGLGAHSYQTDTEHLVIDASTGFATYAAGFTWNWLLSKISCFYAFATICVFLSFSLIPPGKGIAIRSATRSITNIILSKFYVQEQNENQLQNFELYFGFPLALAGIFILAISTKSQQTVAGYSFLGIDAKNTAFIGYSLSILGGMTRGSGMCILRKNKSQIKSQAIVIWHGIYLLFALIPLSLIFARKADDPRDGPVTLELGAGAGEYGQADLIDDTQYLSTETSYNNLTRVTSMENLSTIFLNTSTKSSSTSNQNTNFDTTNPNTLNRFSTLNELENIESSDRTAENLKESPNSFIYLSIIIFFACSLAVSAIFLCAHSLKFAPSSITSLVMNGELFTAMILDHVFIERSVPPFLEVFGASLIFISTISIPLYRLKKEREETANFTTLQEDKNVGHYSLDQGNFGDEPVGVGSQNINMNDAINNYETNFEDHDFESMQAYEMERFGR